jgi:hypothetical protein
MTGRLTHPPFPGLKTSLDIATHAGSTLRRRPRKPSGPDHSPGGGVRHRPRRAPERRPTFGQWCEDNGLGFILMPLTRSDLRHSLISMLLGNDKRSTNFKSDDAG